jgi:hypothetical protein
MTRGSIAQNIVTHRRVQIHIPRRVTLIWDQGDLTAGIGIDAGNGI